MKKRLIVAAIGLILIITVVIFGRLFLVSTIEESYAAEPVNIKAGDALARSGITHGQSIIGINEDRAARAIEAAYPENSLDVLYIERVFPSKVIIHLKERVPVAAVVTAGNSDRYALADVDFQYNKVVSAGEIDGYILITGAKVDSTFNTPVFASIRKIFTVFADLGTPEYALPSVISEIAYQSDKITVVLRNGSSFYVPTNAPDIYSAAKEAYLSL